MLNDDYVKFMRFAQWQIERTGKGIVGLISNHGWIDNVTFRGMRESLLQVFDQLYILDLHGNIRKKERAPDGSEDEGVFAIQQGTAISTFIKHSVNKHPVKKQTLAHVRHLDLWGLKKKKYTWLENNNTSTTEWQELKPRSSDYFFIPRSDAFRSEYKQGWKVTDIFKNYSSGVTTHKDKLTIQWTKEDIRNTIEQFTSLSEEQAREHFSIRPDTRDWKVSLAQKDLFDHNKKYEYIVPIFYRPFDIRYTWYSGRVRGFISMPRREIMLHMLKRRNLGLITARQQSQYHTLWSFISVSQNIIESCTTSNKAYLFPLYLYDDESMVESEKRSVNLQKDFLDALSQRIELQFTKTPTHQKNTFTPEHVLDYIYAILHSTRYRQRYAEYLKTDFPRLPLAADCELFFALVVLGEELRNLHLLDVDKIKALVHPEIRYIGKKIPRIEQSYPQYENGKVMLNDGCHFEDVTEDNLEFSCRGLPSV